MSVPRRVPGELAQQQHEESSESDNEDASLSKGSVAVARLVSLAVRVEERMVNELQGNHRTATGNPHPFIRFIDAMALETHEPNDDRNISTPSGLSSVFVGTIRES